MTSIKSDCTLLLYRSQYLFCGLKKTNLKKNIFSDHISFDLTIKLVYDVKFWDNVDLENCKQT